MKKLNLDYVKENIMRRFAFVLAAAMIAFVCCGCSSTKIIQKNKFEIHELKQKVIAVYVNFSNYKLERPELREQIETEVQNQFLIKDIKSYKTAGCFKNKESSSDSEYQEFLSDNNIDLLCVSVTVCWRMALPPTSPSSIPARNPCLSALAPIRRFAVPYGQGRRLKITAWCLSSRRMWIPFCREPVAACIMTGGNRRCGERI